MENILKIKFALPVIAFTGALGVAGLSGCGSDNVVLLNTAPPFVNGTVQRTLLDGSSNDLLTAGQIGRASCRERVLVQV